MRYTLILGNQAYSSWSLRGWLLLRAFGIEFDYEVVPLRTGEFDRFVEKYHPARTVPTLVVGDGENAQPIWDSLAIAEYLHERHPHAGLWPERADARAAARCLAAEMHSSFPALRSGLPMNVRREYRDFTPDSAAEADIDRILALWDWARTHWGDGGPYLFGDRFCAADAFYAPVASRFRTYGVRLDAAAQRYVDALLEHPAVVEFVDAGKAESWVMPENEFDDPT